MATTLKSDWRNYCVAFFALLAGGCQLFGFGQDDPMQDLREQIESTVPDETRVRKMLRLVDAIDGKIVEMAEVVVTDLEEERVLFADYDSTRADFQALFARSILERRELQRALLALHIEFKSHLNDEEWDVILPVHRRAVTARANAAIVAALGGRGGG